MAEALVATRRVETIRVGIAIVVFEHALVNVETARSVAKESVFALAFKRARQVDTNRKRFIARRHTFGAFVNVHAVTRCTGESWRAAA